MYNDHEAIMYLFSKKDAKPKLIRWIRLLQEFYMEIRYRNGTKNQIVDRLLRLDDSFHVGNEGHILEEFPNKQLLALDIAQLPWYANIVNFF